MLAGVFLLLAGCNHDDPASLLARSDAANLPPGIDTVEEAVDGLIVGHRLMAAGEYELALRAYTRSAAEQGINPDVLSALGSANLMLGRLGQAEELLRKAVEQDPEFVPALNNLGVVLMEKGQAGEAALTFRTAFGLDGGKSDQIRENLKRALAKLEKTPYGDGKEHNFELVRRGNGRFLLLSTPASEDEQ